MKDQVVLDDFLRKHGLATAEESAVWVPLTGGISSEIWRGMLPGRSICVKRALPKLRVAADWEAPISRNDNEWRWLCFAAGHVPAAVPRPLAHDKELGLFAMSFLAPEDHPVWKSQLLKGEVVPQFAAQVGTVLAQLHLASFQQPDLVHSFDLLQNFHVLRIEPYFWATGTKNLDLVDRLHELARCIISNKCALVHGDVSPKNVLAGPAGPILLDAECAWYGDPAFDVAFCLNHILLKCLIRTDRLAALLQCYVRFADSYFEVADFAPRDLIEARAAELLPALMLARVDGKSPVEYLVQKGREQEIVRRFARAFLIKRNISRLSVLADAWADVVNALMKSE